MNNTTVTTAQQNITVTSGNETVTIVDGSATNVTVAPSPAAHIGNGFHYRSVTTIPSSGFPSWPFADDVFWAGGDDKALAWNPDYDAAHVLDLKYSNQGITVANTAHHAFGRPLGNPKKIRLFFRNPRLQSGLFFAQTGNVLLDGNADSNVSGVKVMVVEKHGLRKRQRQYYMAFTLAAKEAEQAVGNDFDSHHVIESVTSLNTAHAEFALSKIALSGIDGGTF